jgi:tRNA-2-methylthio-N6-dimethylallyladenosine synthase
MSSIRKAMPNLKDARNRRKEETLRIEYEVDKSLLGMGNGKTYHVFTYGCQGNEADSEVISGILESLGYKRTEEESADVVILNTCAIRENAENRIWGVLGRLKGDKNKKKDMVIGICGCMPQEENSTNKLIETYPQVDIIFGTHNINHLPNLIKEVYDKKKRVVEVLSTQGNILENAPKIRESKFKAWVNIMYGCDEFCTYCIVPYTRGKERSRDKEDIIKEVKDLVAKGYQEVTLLGQNVNAYGKDKGLDYTFGDLLYDLDKTGIKRIRYTTSHPRDLDDKTIYAMRDCKSVMPHLHLPVQSGDNEVLKRMNRKYTHEEYMEKVNKLKKEVPGIAITTDIIVAFPGETEEQFKHTLDLVDEVEYDGAYTFIYSPREGTPASRMENTLTQEEKDNRLQTLIKKVNEYYLKGNERFVGTIQEVLVDGKSKNGEGMLCGYTGHNKLTHFKSDDLSLIGKIVKVKITEAKTWFVIGELCE